MWIARLVAGVANGYRLVRLKTGPVYNAGMFVSCWTSRPRTPTMREGPGGCEGWLATGPRRKPGAQLTPTLDQVRQMTDGGYTSRRNIGREKQKQKQKKKRKRARERDGLWDPSSIRDLSQQLLAELLDL